MLNGNHLEKYTKSRQGIATEKKKISTPWSKG
jgi:hypothetical protein